MPKYLLAHEDRSWVGYVDDDPFECGYDGPEEEIKAVVDTAALIIDTATRPGPGLDMNTHPREDDPARPLSNTRKAIKFAARIKRNLDSVATTELCSGDSFDSVDADVDAPVVIRHDIDQFTESTSSYIEAKARELATVLPESEAQLRQRIETEAWEYGFLDAPVRELRNERDAWSYIKRGPEKPPYLQE